MRHFSYPFQEDDESYNKRIARKPRSAITRYHIVYLHLIFRHTYIAISGWIYRKCREKPDSKDPSRYSFPRGKQFAQVLQERALILDGAIGT